MASAHAEVHSTKTPEEAVEDRRWFEMLDDDTQSGLTAEERAEVRFLLGRMNYEGIGGPKDHAEAARLFGLATIQGHAKAQYSLGLMLREGEGGPQDCTEARRLLGLAVAQGYTEAQAALGMMLWRGEGGPEDYAEARRLLMPAAEKGDARACYILACMHNNGQGGPRKTLPRQGACLELRQRRATPRLNACWV